MEKKKLLYIAISVGLFLVIALGSAIIIVSKQNADPSAVARQPYTPGLSGTIVPNVSSIGTPAAVVPSLADVQEAADTSGTENRPASVDTVSLLHNPDINVLQRAPEEPAPSSINHSYGDSGAANASDIRIERYTPRGAAARNSEPRRTPSVPVSRPNAADVPPSPPAQITRVQPPVQTPAPLPAQPKVYNNFWVQTGSFSAKVRADNVKESLGAKGISSVIEVRNINDQTYYRVRVGPYTSQNEAAYWLSLIQSIDGFEESQIWQSQSTR